MRFLLLALFGACTEYEIKKKEPSLEGETADTGDPGGDPTPEDTDDPSEPTIVEQVDQFDLSDEMGTDLLFFGDTSGSMAEELTTMGEKITTLIDSLTVYTDEWQLMAVTGPTGCGVTGVLTPETAEYAALFATGLLTPPGTDEVDEWGLYNAWQAVEATDEGECNAGFLREDARLHIIFISDEDDNSPGWDAGDPSYWMTYTDAIYARKGDPNKLRFSGVIGPTPDGCTGAEPGTGYADAIEAFGGTVLSICDDWASQVELLVDTTVQYDTFTLSRTPMEGTLEVFVNGDNRSSGWSHDETQNAVVFTEEIPVTGDNVEIFYLVET